MYTETSTFYCNSLLSWLCTGTPQTVWQSEKGWMVGGSNSSGGKILLPPPSLLYNGYWVYSLGIQQPGQGIAHPPFSSADIKERLELSIYSLSGPSWPVLGWTYLYPSSLHLSHGQPLLLTVFHGAYCTLKFCFLNQKYAIHILLYVYIIQTHFGKMFQKIYIKFQ